MVKGCKTAIVIAFSWFGFGIALPGSHAFQYEQLELDELINDAVLEEISHRLDISSASPELVAKAVLTLTKKPCSQENMALLKNYIPFAIQQRVGSIPTPNLEMINASARLIIEDLIMFTSKLSSEEVKKNKPASNTLSRIAILGCCAYLVKLLFGVYSTVNSVLGVVTAAQTTYSQIKESLGGLSGLVAGEGEKTRSFVHSGADALGARVDASIKGLATVHKQEIAVLSAQLEAQQRELLELQAEAATATGKRLAAVSRKLAALSGSTKGTLEKLQKKLKKLERAERESAARGDARVDASHAAQTELHVELARISEQVTQALERVAALAHGVERVDGHVEQATRDIAGLRAKVGKVSARVKDGGKGYAALQAALLEAIRNHSAAKTTPEREQTWGDVGRQFATYAGKVGVDVAAEYARSLFAPLNLSARLVENLVSMFEKSRPSCHHGDTYHYGAGTRSTC